MKLLYVVIGSFFVAYISMDLVVSYIGYCSIFKMEHVYRTGKLYIHIIFQYFILLHM
jgi:hypothetical protein